ncbi:Hypothetical predicted protein [Octopus vulgaris]|uniref:Uncharacterized protein n=1 Tax=Octopus vulgaris TaxID=6645 RepID=A0AA36ARW1_OCTVU|nr:Hypothetical predicted protein [Octopus vulgaris]
MINMINSNVSIGDFQRNFSLASAGTFAKTWGKFCSASSASEVKEAEKECGELNILEITRFPIRHTVLQSLDAKEIEMWVRQEEETTEQCPEENNGHEISDSDSSHSSKSDVNGQEHSNEEISWDNAEKSMESVIKFLERNPLLTTMFSKQCHFERI